MGPVHHLKQQDCTSAIRLYSLASLAWLQVLAPGPVQQSHACKPGLRRHPGRLVLPLRNSSCAQTHNKTNTLACAHTHAHTDRDRDVDADGDAERQTPRRRTHLRRHPHTVPRTHTRTGTGPPGPPRGEDNDCQWLFFNDSLQGHREASTPHSKHLLLLQA